MRIIFGEQEGEEDRSFNLAIRLQWYEVLITSFSYPGHIRAGGGQSSTLPSHLPTHRVQVSVLIMWG